MFLAVDIGNTHVVLGLFEGQRVRNTWRIGSDPARTEDETRILIRSLFFERGVDPAELKGAMVCSVIPKLSQTFRNALHELTGKDPLVLTHKLSLGIHNLYQHPENVGPDRLANAVGGVERYGAPLIVVDFGTATTFDVISRKREYLGGIILPGLDMSADALFQKTSLLPRIAIELPERVIGHSTLEAITSGIVCGTAATIDSLSAEIRKELGEPDCPIVATGGYAATLSKICTEIERVDPDLTLYGILKVWERNVLPIA